MPTADHPFRIVFAIEGIGWGSESRVVPLQQCVDVRSERLHTVQASGWCFEPGDLEGPVPAPVAQQLDLLVERRRVQYKPLACLCEVSEALRTFVRPFMKAEPSCHLLEVARKSIPPKDQLRALIRKCLLGNSELNHDARIVIFALCHRTRS